MTGLLESLDRWLPHARAQIAAHEVAPRLEQIGRIRQDQITDELLELATGTEAAR